MAPPIATAKRPAVRASLRSLSVHANYITEPFSGPEGAVKIMGSTDKIDSQIGTDFSSYHASHGLVSLSVLQSKGGSSAKQIAPDGEEGENC